MIRADISIIRTNRKSYSIQVHADGKVVVKAPLHTTMSEIDKILREKENWINDKLQQYSKIRSEVKKEDTTPFTQEQIRGFAKRLEKILPDKLEKYARMVGVDYNNVTIRNQKTRWGSCSGKANLNFNCLLVEAPERVMDYVIVHELCHLKEMNHSDAFWCEVEKVMPDYREQREWLRTNGIFLMKRMYP